MTCARSPTIDVQNGHTLQNQPMFDNAWAVVNKRYKRTLLWIVLMTLCVTYTTHYQI